MLQEIYEVTNDQNDSTLLCLFACEPINFEEAVQNKKWWDATDKENKAIEKNNTWELYPYWKEQKQLE